jgi:hypothetical protein
MKVLIRAFNELLGLFVDDGSLALAALLVLGAAGLLVGSGLMQGQPALVLLAGGIVAALLENVLRSARRK